MLARIIVAICFICLSSPVLAQTNGVEPCLSDFLKEEPKRPEGVKGAVFQRSKKWLPGQTLRVRFLDGPAVWKAKIVQYSQIWEQYANLDFVFVDSGPAEIRISFAFQPGAAWSFFGRDSERISMVKVGNEYRSAPGTDGPSMNYGTFNANTPEAEFKRKALHEFGHAIGLHHEHQNGNGDIIYDEEKVFEYYFRTSGWDPDRVRSQVLKRYGPGTDITNGDYDRLSIMHYPVDPALTKNNRGVAWNSELSEGDKAVVATLYPFNGNRPLPTNTGKVDPKPQPTGLLPEVLIKNLEIDFEATDKTEEIDGMGFILDFDVNNALKQELTIAIYFYEADGAALVDTNKQFFSANGKVAVFSKFTPQYQRAAFKQFKVFMPYDELELECGEHDLKYSIGVWKGATRVISTGYEYFSFYSPCEDEQ
ncbi:MAG: matrixin family metalloprotease [Acidobacteria bacterium]|nr:matrixin family metalloprotease [Acidobacteriota bacterium]